MARKDGSWYGGRRGRGSGHLQGHLGRTCGRRTPPPGNPGTYPATGSRRQRRRMRAYYDENRVAMRTDRRFHAADVELAGGYLQVAPAVAEKAGARYRGAGARVVGRSTDGHRGHPGSRRRRAPQATDRSAALVDTAVAQTQRDLPATGADPRTARARATAGQTRRNAARGVSKSRRCARHGQRRQHRCRSHRAGRDATPNEQHSDGAHGRAARLVRPASLRSGPTTDHGCLGQTMHADNVRIAEID